MKALVFSIALLFLLSFANAETKDEYSSYNEYYIKIKDLYVHNLKLSKSIKDNQIIEKEAKIKLQTSISQVTKYCSTSFESQIYFDSQKQNRQKEKYAYVYNQVSKDLHNKRLDVYKKCKRMQALLSRVSFRVTQKSDNHITRVDVQNHEGLFSQTQHVYKELLIILDKLSLNQSYEAQKNVVSYYQNYKGYDCDWNFERELYSNAKTFLKSKLSNANKIVNEDRRRGVASSSPSFRYENVLSDLERRHVSFEKICEEIQHSKDRINSIIKKLY